MSEPTAADTTTAPAEQPTEQPEDKQVKFREFMGKLMGDIARLHSQTDYFARRTTGELNDLGQRLDHIEQCLGMLFEAMHIEMPKQTPRLLDATVELVATDALPEGEVCELRASFSQNPHPVYGNYQIVIGAGEDIQASMIDNLHPIVGTRMKQAFAALTEAGTLVDGQFYYVRLQLIHGQPINETSVRFSTDESAANDDSAAASETTDDQPE